MHIYKSVLETQNNRTFGKRQYHMDELFFGIVGFIIAIFAVARCFFGIEITDEAYQVADVYSVFQGNLPFAYNTSNAAGASLVSFPFMFIFRLFASGNEGVFLYMRLCFTFFRLLVICIIYVLLRKRYTRRALIPACVLLVAWFGSIIPNFSYNTSSFWLMFLSCVMISVAYKENRRKDHIALFIAGYLAALSVFAHAMQIGAVLTVCVLLVFLSDKGHKVLNFGLYAAGGITQIAVVLLPIAAQVGMKSLVTGIDLMLFHRLKYAKVDVIQRFIDFLLWLKAIYGRLIFLFLVAMIVCWLSNKFFKFGWKLKYRWLLSAVFALIPVVLYYGRGGSDSVSSYFGAISFWTMIMILPLIRDSLAYFLIFPFLTFFLFEVIFPGLGSASKRVYFMYPAVFVTVVLLLGAYKESGDSKNGNVPRKMLKLLVGVFACVTAILVIRSEYLYVYREDPISQLDYKVTEGIYKGIYTSKDRAECTIEIEKYIKANTSSGERVSFRDNVPFGYLMSNGNMCDIRTWDAMQYSYIESGSVEDNPINMYRYYKNTGNIPEKYIYIDYGRDEIVSYDSPTFKFNKWLNTYYHIVDDIRINARYSARIYEYNGNFDGDYDYWINSVEE